MSWRRDVCTAVLAGFLLVLGAAPSSARADSDAVVGSWRCMADPDPSLPEGSETFLVSFDVGRTVLTTNTLGNVFRGAGTWQRSGRRVSAREVLNGVGLLAESEFRLERGSSLSFERVLSPLEPGAPLPTLRFVGTCSPLRAVPREGAASPRFVGSWRCSADDPDRGQMNALLSFTFSLGQTAKSSLAGSAQGQGTWAQSGPRTLTSTQKLLVPPGLVADLDATLMQPPGAGPVLLRARIAAENDPTPQLDLVGTCTEVETEPAAAGPLPGSVVGSWFCRSNDDQRFAVTFEQGQTFLATSGITGHGAWRRTGRSSFVSRDALVILPFGFLDFDSAYELDRTGALSFERTGFLTDPTTGERLPVQQQSGSCQRIEVGGR